MRTGICGVSGTSSLCCVLEESSSAPEEAPKILSGFMVLRPGVHMVGVVAVSSAPS